MTAALVAGLLAGYGIALPVGAVAACLVALTVCTSLRVGAAAALGVATADGLYALLAALGGAALVGIIQPVAAPLRRFAAVVLIAVAIRLIVTAVRQHRSGQRRCRSSSLPSTPVRAYLSLVALTTVNPTTVIYFTAVVVGARAGSVASPAGQAAFAVAAFAASASWQLCLAAGGALLGRLLTGPRGRLITALISSTMTVVLAAHLA